MMDDPDSAAPRGVTTLAMQTIADALRGLRFGSVTIVVQDGAIVQVERIEKKRLARPAQRGAGV